jgi:hypothetical protein
MKQAMIDIGGLHMEKCAYSLRAEQGEVRRIREALLPLGYWVYGVGKPAMGGTHVEIHARIPEDEADRERLEQLLERDDLLFQHTV